MLEPHDDDWKARGACRGPQNDPDWWFSTDPTVIRNAKRICETECEVRERCLEWAQDTRHKYGIAGGLTSKERKVSAHA